MLKIVLTGGPCAGKSEALSRLTQLLEARGYKVFTVPEAATFLILNGICPSANISMEKFQKFVLDAQIETERIFGDAVKYYDEDKVIFFYDRGIMDGCAYVDKDSVFLPLLADKGISISEAFNRYDAVLHLVTAANGAEKFYQWNDPSKENVGNNAARSESPEEARIKDKKTLNSWVGHPHLRVFDNSTDFNGKINRIVEEVFALLGEPIPKEIERKFLIKMPTDAQIAALGCVSKTNIIQTYLKKSKDVTERRIRQRGNKQSGFSFYYTEKTDLEKGIRIENERKISADEYLQLLTEADTSLHQISKTRYCFVYRNQYFELDIYPFDKRYAILEIELNDLNETISYPPLNFIKEVTNDIAFRNVSLAQKLSFGVADNLPEQHFGCGFGKSLVTNVPAEEWIYETGRDEPEILGSGSHKYDVVKTRDEKYAFRLSKENGRNYIRRYRIVQGLTVSQWYDGILKTWI